MPDNRELYGTSDIEWREIGPKLFELSNRQPALAPAPPPETAQEAAGLAMSQKELEHFNKAKQMKEPRDPHDYTDAGFAQRPPKGKYGRQWRRDLRNIRKPGDTTGLRGLFERGDVWIDPNGDVFSHFPISEFQLHRLMGALRNAPDQFVDHLRDLSGNVKFQFDPNDPKWAGLEEDEAYRLWADRYVDEAKKYRPYR